MNGMEAAPRYLAQHNLPTKRPTFPCQSGHSPTKMKKVYVIRAHTSEFAKERLEWTPNAICTDSKTSGQRQGMVNGTAGALKGPVPPECLFSKRRIDLNISHGRRHLANKQSHLEIKGLRNSRFLRLYLIFNFATAGAWTIFLRPFSLFCYDVY